MVKTAITEQWQEGRDYELIPREDDHWHVNILKGDYSSCIISYDKVSIDEQNLLLKFDYTLQYTPVSGITSDDPQLQKVASHILHSILLGVLDNDKR